MGGFNTPIEGSAEGVNALITSNLHEPLKKNDKMYLQFRNYAKSINKDDIELMNDIAYDNSHTFVENNLLSSYHEGEIMFGPTFKTVPFTDAYDTTVKMPKEFASSGWTDRIIWTTKPKDSFTRNLEFIKQISYDSNNLLKSSQYRPVFSQFTIKF